MNRVVFSYILKYYDREVAKMIMQKYGIDELEAVRRFINSETYNMLSDIRLEMWEFGYPALFNMWECEQITGDPRNSSYFRG